MGSFPELGEAKTLGSPSAKESSDFNSPDETLLRLVPYSELNAERKIRRLVELRASRLIVPLADCSSFEIMGEGEGGLDKRVEFVLRRIYAVFGYSKYDKFKSTILNQKEDSPLRAIETFLDDPECTAFFAYQGSGESLVATTQSPGSVAQIKKKVLIVCRAKAEVEISADNMVDCIVVQELSKRLLENINSLLNGA
ncbi:hypothetical protein FOZ62_019399, partial [Perkinsus olseni]